MDALGLVLPAATITNAASSASDVPAADADAGSINADFAALLAGLLPPLQVAALAPFAAPVEAETLLPAGDAATALPLTVGVPSAETGLASHAGAARATHELTTAAAPLESEQPVTTAAPATTVSLAAAAQPASVAAPAAFAADAAIAAPALQRTQETVAAPASEAPPVPTETLSAHALLHTPAEKGPGPQPLAVLDVKAPVDTPEFAPQLSQQVVWMADKDAQIAQLRINPPELGPVEVRLQLNGDEASVQFVSAHADVRNALEAAIARLRESFAEAGIRLGEASVGAESFRDDSRANGGRDQRGAARERDGDSAWSASASDARVQHGLIDLFA